MGFDTSHHPVDVNFITGRLVPYVLGDGEIDDLVEAAVRIAKTRFRANAWGLGASRFFLEHDEEFAGDLYLWGRPFFVTVDGTKAIASAIDRYLEADPDDVDFIAAEMLDALDPRLVGQVQPSEDGSLPADAALAAGLRRNLDLLREAVRNVESRTPVDLGGGDSADPRELLERETIWVLTNFAANFRPGWMDRGQVWPTAWAGEANVAFEGVFESPRALLGQLETLDIDFFAPVSIVENYMVGALAPAEKVSSLIPQLERHEQALTGAWGEPDEYTRTSFRKLLEAARDAEHRGLAFCEATEIYSGFSGIMN